MQTVTFINHDAKHLNITRRDIRSINTHVNSHIATRTRARKDDEAASLVSSSSPLSYQIGGLRTDPFRMLPIESRGAVPKAFDYCQCSVIDRCVAYTKLTLPDTHTYLPACCQVGIVEPIQAQTLMLNILHDPMLCESIIAMTLMMQNLHLDISNRLSTAIVFHSNNVISKLRQVLLEPEGMHSDLVIVVISSQAIIQVSTKQFRLTLLDSDQILASCLPVQGISCPC
jgi:hypothetical protein